jgi:hypothetical protein
MGASNTYRYYCRQPDVKFACHIDLMGIGDADVDEFAMPVNDEYRQTLTQPQPRKPDITAAYQECDAPLNDHGGCGVALERLMAVARRTPTAQVQLAVQGRRESSTARGDRAMNSRSTTRLESVTICILPLLICTRREGACRHHQNYFSCRAPQAVPGFGHR